MFFWNKDRYSFKFVLVGNSWIKNRKFFLKRKFFFNFFFFFCLLDVRLRKVCFVSFFLKVYPIYKVFYKIIDCFFFLVKTQHNCNLTFRTVPPIKIGFDDWIWRLQKNRKNFYKSFECVFFCFFCVFSKWMNNLLKFSSDSFGDFEFIFKLQNFV